MKKNTLFSFLFFALLVLLFHKKGVSQEEQASFTDTTLLNTYILEEINHLRKKARALPLEINKGLRAAAEDHALFLTTSKKLTHFQKRNKKKYTPDDRITFYGVNFDVVGENIQQIMISDITNELNSNKKLDDPYRALAKLLVKNWRKSPPHYKNLIDKEYNFTYTAIVLANNGRLYACQLFSGNYH